MAGLTDTLRGDGLARAQRALAGLQGDPLRLDRERQRFSQSPPAYGSNPSGTTTRSPSPIPPSEQRREERYSHLVREHCASDPYHQYEHQLSDEIKRITEADLNQTRRLRVGDDPDKIASENVKRRWVEQGIWNSTWNSFASGRWKHEEPLELDSESETDSEAGPSPPLFSFAPKPQPRPRLPKSDDEKRRAAEQRAIREREREASRPYQQFIYQISKERERIQEESENGGGADAADINTRAYENVKCTWTKRGIWNKRWGVLPAMSWKHEQPLEEFLREEMGDDPVAASPVVNGSHEAPFRRIFGSPSLFEPDHRQDSGALNPSSQQGAPGDIDPAESNNESDHRQESGALNPSSQQGAPGDIDPAESNNGYAERSVSAPNSPSPSSGQRVLRATTGQALLPSKRNASHQDGRRANASLGPVHSAKVTKAAGKRGSLQRRLSHSQKADSPPSDVDAAEPEPSPSPDRAKPRRSKWLQPPAPGVSKDPTGTAASNPSKRAVRSKTERKVASTRTTRSSAKPQGVTKRQPAKTTRGKQGKKKMKN